MIAFSLLTALHSCMRARLRRRFVFILRLLIMPIHCVLLLLLMLLGGFLLGVAVFILTLLAGLRWILLVLILTVQALLVAVGRALRLSVLLWALILSTVAA